MGFQQIINRLMPGRRREAEPAAPASTPETREATVEPEQQADPPEVALIDQEQETVDPVADVAASAVRYVEIGEVVPFRAEGDDLYAIRTGDHDRDFVIRTPEQLADERQAERDELEL